MYNSVYVSGDDWVDINTLSGVPVGSPFLLQNVSVGSVILQEASSKPSITDNKGMELFNAHYGDLSEVSIEEGKERLWAKLRNLNSPTILKVVDFISGLYGGIPEDLYTSDVRGKRRVRVDTGQTSFYEGREFRVNEEFSIPVGGKLLWKYVIGVNTILTLSSIEVDQGGALYRVYSAAQTTETSPFNTPVTIYNKNLMTTAPVYATQNQIFKGGDATFTGIPNSTTRVRTAAGNGNRSSAVESEQQQRGFPPTIAYVEISALDGVNVETLGILKQEWQEVP